MRLVCVGGPFHEEDFDVPLERVRHGNTWDIPRKVDPPKLVDDLLTDPLMPGIVVERYTIHCLQNTKHWYLVHESVLKRFDNK